MNSKSLLNLVICLALACVVGFGCALYEIATTENTTIEYQQE